MNKGIVLTLSAYLFWGLHPIYWKLLGHVSPLEIVSHRILWSLVFFVCIVSACREWKEVILSIRKTENKGIIILPALLIGSNWALYIWAVNTENIIETSLGYFICPLFSVFLGVLILNERLRRMQWIAVIIAAIGVLVMIVIYGHFPWIALSLATTWGLYGLARKRSPLSSAHGLMIEAILLSVPALCYLMILGFNGGSMIFSGYKTSLLLMGSGIISGLPLFIYIAGVRRTHLSVVGILQYIYPVLILITGVYLFHEVLHNAHFAGLGFTWVALSIFSIDGVLNYSK